MPFGLKMSQDIFLMGMDQIIHWPSSVISTHDNISVFGCTYEEHDYNLHKCMWVVKDNLLLTFNCKKFQINLLAISLYGGISFQMVRSWMQRCPGYSGPTHTTEHKWLQSFLGVVNYMEPFMPSMSTITGLLQEQLKHSDWKASIGAVFQCLKAFLA